MKTQRPTTAPQTNALQCSIDQGFQDWISKSNGSIVLSSYQAGKVLLIGWNGQQVTFLPREFNQPMGIAVNTASDEVAIALKKEVIVLKNSPALADMYLPDQPGKYDALYLPRMTLHTGEMSIHDMAYGCKSLWAVNTRFSCVGTLTANYTFEPFWKPPFVSKDLPEDRCHLNGMAMLNDKPSVVTALGETDTPGGWRSNKVTGGVIIDVETNQIIVRGLSMPHSPRWHTGELHFLNSGQGALCKIHPTSHKIKTIISLPGYLRGLTICSNFALVGLSKIRGEHIFGGLPVQQIYQNLKCGIAIIDLRLGQQVGMLEFTGGATELYDVQFLSGFNRPNILNLEKPETAYAYTSPQHSHWLRPEYFEDIEKSSTGKV